jgi:hypothetical protein
MKLLQIFRITAAGSVLLMLMSSCCLSPSGHVGSLSEVAPDAAEIRFEATTIKQPVSATAAVITGVAWAVQNRETIKATAGGVYSALRKDKKTEPLPQRSADSQGIFGYVENY